MNNSFKLGPNSYPYTIKTQEDYDKKIAPLLTCSEDIQVIVKRDGFVHLKIIDTVFNKLFSNGKALKAELNFEIAQLLHLGIECNYRIKIKELNSRLSKRKDIDDRVKSILETFGKNQEQDKSIYLKKIRAVLIEMYQENKWTGSLVQENFQFLGQTHLNHIRNFIKDKNVDSTLFWIKNALNLNNEDPLFEKQFQQLMDSLDSSLLKETQYLLLQQAILSKDPLKEEKYLQYGLKNNFSKFNGNEDFEKHCLNYCIKKKESNLILSHIDHWKSKYKDNIEMSSLIAEIFWMTSDFDYAIQMFDTIKQKLTSSERHVRLAPSFFKIGQHLISIKKFDLGEEFIDFAQKLDPSNKTYQTYFFLAKGESPPPRPLIENKKKPQFHQSTTLNSLKDSLAQGDNETAAKLFLKLPNSELDYSLKSNDFLQIGQAFIVARNFEKALECYRISVELNPNDINQQTYADLYLDIWNTKITSICNLSTGKLENLLVEEGLLETENPLQLNIPIKTFSEFKLSSLIGHAYFQIGKTSHARNYFETARKIFDAIDPNLFDYKRLFGDKNLMKHLDKALESFDKVAALVPDSLKEFPYLDLSFDLWSKKIASIEKLTKGKLEALLKQDDLIEMGQTLEETDPMKVNAKFKMYCLIGDAYLELKESSKARDYFATAFDILENIQPESSEDNPFSLIDNASLAKLFFSFGKVLWQLNNEKDPYFKSMLELVETAKNIEPENSEFSDFFEYLKKAFGVE